MPLKEERLATYLDNLERLVTEGGEENFVVFEDPATDRFVQFASRRGADEVLLDVPTTPQDVGDDGRGTLEALGLERDEDVWYEVDRRALASASDEIKTAVHGWIAGGRDPADERLPELETRGVVEKVGGPERESYQTVTSPERGAALAERVMREVLGSDDEHEVHVELHLQEGRDASDWLEG